MTKPSSTKKLMKGDLLFREGEVSGAMYLIRSGSIRIFKRKGDSQIEIDTLRSGQIVGEMGFLDGNPRSASAEAMTESELVEISTTIYESTMVQVPEWLKVLLKAIVARLRATTTRLKNLESASMEMDYAEGRRNFVFVSPHDALKLASAFLLAGSRSPDKWGSVKIGAVERYANQVMGIPLAKVAAFAEVLRKSDVIRGEETASEFSLNDPSHLEGFIHYVCDENLLEPSKRHDIGFRAFTVMSFIVKHLDRFPANPENGISTINLAWVKKTETEALGREAFSADDFSELVKVGYASELKVLSTEEQTTAVHAEGLKRVYRAQRILKTIEAVNVEKQRLSG
jgi:CRP/FNR family cyclic AMP-dependent transcriptional regulator